MGFSGGRLFPIFKKFDRNIFSRESLKSGSFVRSIVNENIPQNVSITASGSIVFPDITHRNGYCLLENSCFDSEYILIDTKRLHWLPDKKEELTKSIESILKQQGIDLVASNGRIFLLHRSNIRKKQSPNQRYFHSII